MNSVDMSRVLAELRSVASQAQGHAGLPAQTGVSGFSEMLSQAVDKVNDMQKTAQTLSSAYEAGDPQVSLAETMIAMQKANIAFQAAITVRNKVVSAYQEIMSMPV